MFCRAEYHPQCVSTATNMNCDDTKTTRFLFLQKNAFIPDLSEETSIWCKFSILDEQGGRYILDKENIDCHILYCKIDVLCNYGRGSPITFVNILTVSQRSDIKLRIQSFSSESPPKMSVHGQNPVLYFNRTGAIRQLERKLPVILIIDLSFKSFFKQKMSTI